VGGFFGVASKSDCVADLFYGTDYHSHLGTVRGGMAVSDGSIINSFIHDITNSQFRSKFEGDIQVMQGNSGIGVISDFDDQPLVISSHLGVYAIVTVGVIQNIDNLAQQAFDKRNTHFCEMSGGAINPTELVATIINQEESFAAGLTRVQDSVEGSCSVLLLTAEGIFASRDKLGRTPVVLGKKDGAWAVSLETCAFPNLEFEVDRYIGPGEIVKVTADAVETLKTPRERMQICAFLWVYYGYPASSYEGINTEDVRNKCGAALARRDNVEVDLVAGIPDSGTGHAIGYANEAGVPYGRPFVKYTPTWPRSFMPQDQRVRDLVARMKLIPVRELLNGRRVLFCEDSIVRGTQLQDTVQRLYSAGTKEVHMRPACPPLCYGCKFLNFSRSKSIMDLATRKAIKVLTGGGEQEVAAEYSNPDSQEYAAMLEEIRKRLDLTSLAFQRLDDLVEAIGLPKEKLCTYCWDGAE
jgi:amidophosphoribosyltransferase